MRHPASAGPAHPSSCTAARNHEPPATSERPTTGGVRRPSTQNARTISRLVGALDETPGDDHAQERGVPKDGAGASSCGW